MPPSNNPLGHQGQAAHTLGAILISLPHITKAWVHSKRVQWQITLTTVLGMATRRAKVEAGNPVLEQARFNKGLDLGIDKRQEESLSGLRGIPNSKYLLNG